MPAMRQTVIICFCALSAIVLLSFDIFRGRRDTMYGAAAKSVGSVILMPPGVYVAVTGSDASSGTDFKAPLRTIPYALSRAAAQGITNIYIGKGTYSRGNGINAAGDGLVVNARNIRVVGGYTVLSYGWARSAGDMSVLDGNSLLSTRVLAFSNATNVLFDGFVITGGTNVDGAGILLVNAESLVITNTIVSNTGKANAAGAAIRIEVTSRWNNIHSTVHGATSWGSGSIISCTGASNILQGSCRSCITDGGYVVDLTGPGNLICASIENNHCAGVIIMYAPSLISNTTMTGNYYAGSGSCVYINGIVPAGIPFGITRSVLYNNFTTAQGVVVLNTAGALSDMRITFNYIGGSLGATYNGIHEQVECSGHTIISNRFNISVLGNLYHDPAPGGSIGTGAIPILNSPGDTLHDAATASGNITTMSPP